MENMELIRINEKIYLLITESNTILGNKGAIEKYLKVTII